METRTERVVLETDRQRVVGDLTLPREGYRSRLSDYLNYGEHDFIALVDAIVTPLAGGGAVEAGPERHEFVAVGRTHIRLARPAAPGDG